MSRSQLDLQCVDVSWRRRETRKSALVSWATTSPGRDKTKASFQLDSRHLRQSHKVKVKAARCGSADLFVNARIMLNPCESASKLTSTNRLGLLCTASDRRAKAVQAFAPGYISWGRREPRKSPLVSWATTCPGRDKTKASFQLDSRHLRQSHKVKVKAVCCGADDGVVQTCLSTLGSCLTHVSPRQSSPLPTVWACYAQLQTDGLKQYKLLRLAAKGCDRFHSLTCNVATFPGGEVKRGSRLWSVGLQRVLEGTKPKHAFSSTVDISGKATRSKSKLLAAEQDMG